MPLAWLLATGYAAGPPVTLDGADVVALPSVPRSEASPFPFRLAR